MSVFWQPLSPHVTLFPTRCVSSHAKGKSESRLIVKSKLLKRCRKHRKSLQNDSSPKWCLRPGQIRVSYKLKIMRWVVLRWVADGSTQLFSPPLLCYFQPRIFSMYINSFYPLALIVSSAWNGWSLGMEVGIYTPWSRPSKRREPLLLEKFNVQYSHDVFFLQPAVLFSQ
jgi:hypothetical protein